MIRRVLFLGEGSSDEGLVNHIERIADDCGVPILLTTPRMDLLDLPDHSVRGKLDVIRKLGGEYDLVIVHRDADGDGPEARLEEIEAAVQACAVTAVCVPVVPVRMTEAWLVLDEPAIRDVAGNPNGRVRLQIPKPSNVERIADPKALLRELLVTASETSGRRRQQFQSRFSHHRRLLLERLTSDGAVSSVSSWLAFDRDLRAGLARIRTGA